VVIGYTKLTLLSLPDSYSESPNIWIVLLL
jgi:hypothetical protein